MSRTKMKTLVLGLGNPILTDDGVGVRVAQAVGSLLPRESSVEISEASVGGLGLMERLLGYERVILIDALFGTGNCPGTVHRLTLDDLQAMSPTQHSVSPHDTNLNTALEMASRMGLPLPEEVVVFGVEVENIAEFCDEPTPAVKRAVNEVADAVLAELKLSIDRDEGRFDVNSEEK